MSAVVEADELLLKGLELESLVIEGRAETP